jgi:hypothetical protein
MDVTLVDKAGSSKLPHHHKSAVSEKQPERAVGASFKGCSVPMPLIIPVQADIPPVSGVFSIACQVDSRLRGNNCFGEWPRRW